MKFTYGTMRVFDWLLTIYVGPGSKVYHKVNCLKALDISFKVQRVVTLILKVQVKVVNIFICQFLQIDK